MPETRLSVLGSTGSIGTQGLQVARAGGMRVVALAAGGSRPDLLAQQALDWEVEFVALADATALSAFSAAYAEAAGPRSRPMPEVLTGEEAVRTAAAWPADVVLNGIEGAAGLPATIAALRAGRRLALANKESLIIGGPLVSALAEPGQITPVDSEHSALAQCLRSGRPSEVRRLILTASGGPFRGWSPASLASVTPAQALKHPTWTMGPLVTVNSATLVNKGLEILEAHLLFGVDIHDIDVVIHPESAVHSMVEFTDGSAIAQASPPDMRLPIALGLSWPDRLAGAAPGFDWSRSRAWHFEPVDHETFPAIGLARLAGERGGTAPAVFNAANEIAVAAFLAGRIPFTAITETIAGVLMDYPDEEPHELADVMAADRAARSAARELIERTY
ncbi:1-deoxy-D-xylulose-5-phosphate reductoisomerase [Longispora albida]|uniref:1-deoxy-D-xylulose-5-phosphate reductoisomerase n=1 Tax=Longispora albida TaxID=203523 RepID=UPI0005905267|nr:1-deoxy-D-xylulose-5-phosphate reductoisomerase [Longispora albida]